MNSMMGAVCSSLLIRCPREERPQKEIANHAAASQKAIDAWFEHKTKGLNNFQRAVLRKRWAIMEELMSAGEHKQRIIASFIEDFSLKPRLNNDRGTAILVAAKYP